ncbi:CXADR-like membrane protein isoform X2 [Rhinatrema bivittatum]|uniref:CXADR-like membrane protein isoform X2 n=1 Tax=Rhinatrema bivittatum TaxID=194408 RepID=UPI00112D31C0|nr:CXADR-like membrane protein isoform X2 [Rhinatrema bivittatum]
MKPAKVCRNPRREPNGERGSLPSIFISDPGDTMPALSILFLVSSSAWWACAQVEITKVAEENVTLPCHHALGLLGLQNLDIEWWLTRNSEVVQNMVISYSEESVYNDLNMNQKGRVSFASNFLAGDASLHIRSLESSDAGQYTCKVKIGGTYQLNHITLKVLVKPSEPKCWMEGEQSEGGNITLECKSSAGTEPIQYRWETVSGKKQMLEVLPSTSLVEISKYARVILWNLSTTHSGLYRCTATNEAGHKNCDVQVTVHRAWSIGLIIGIASGVVVGVLLIILSVFLMLRMRKTKKYEEEEPPNEIREDAEAPKARLIKPGSSSSGSRSSNSGSSSTKSTINSACRSQQTPSTQTASPHYRHVEAKGREAEASKCTHSSPLRMDATPVLIPGQSRAFQTV